MDYLSAKECMEALRARRASSVELVDQAIARIEAHDGKLNAVVVRDFEPARNAARLADEMRAQGEEKPLLGLPITVKESFNVAGLPTSWGIEGFESARAAAAAVVIDRLKQAGAIILGKTNVPTMLADWQSDNPIYGRTHNPWDHERTPGGSSGGSAAALAAGYVPLELGSDIAGSLRAPASFCGVFAHKPSHGLVPLRGHTPPDAEHLSVGPAIDLAVAGPMARSADDLMTALDIIAGPDDAQALAYRLDLPAPRHTSLKDYRVLLLTEHPLVPTSAVVADQINAFAERLEQAGCRIERSCPSLPDLSQIGIVFFKLLMSFLGSSMPDKVYANALAGAKDLQRVDETLDSALVSGIALSHRDWIRNDQRRVAIAHQWRQLFAEWDLVLCPAMPTPAFTHDVSPQRTRMADIDGVSVAYMHQAMWISMATLTGNPATAMPIGLSADGLPIGVQIIGPYLEDRSTIAFAALAEKAFGGFARPPGY